MDKLKEITRTKEFMLNALAIVIYYIAAGASNHEEDNVTHFIAATYSRKAKQTTDKQNRQHHLKQSTYRSINISHLVQGIYSPFDQTLCQIITKAVVDIIDGCDFQ